MYKRHAPCHALIGGGARRELSIHLSYRLSRIDILAWSINGKRG